jgi:agmatinase
MPRTILPNPRLTPRFAGLSTFARYPRLDDVTPENRPIDWLIFGVPYDSGVTYRPGARFAPRAIRDASQYVKAFHLEHNIDVPATLSLADAGDAPVHPYHPKTNLECVASWATDQPDPAHTKLLALGGDHSIAYANIKATWQRRGMPKGGLAVIHFDSHLDTVDAVWGESWGHASPFRRAIEDGFIDPTSMLSIGLKSPLNAPTDLDFARNAGVTIISDTQFRVDGPRRVADFLKALGTRETYITFDIDCIDPAFAPGTGTLSVGGFTSQEALATLRSLRGVNIVGGDVVEVLPDRDPAGITAFLAAHIAFEILALSAISRRS